MFSKPKLHDCSNEVYVQVLGETVVVKFLKDDTLLKQEMSESDYELDINENPLHGICTYAENKIHICESLKAPKYKLRGRSCDCEDCDGEEDEFEDKVYTVENTTKELMNTAIHELLHYSLNSLGRKELSQNEELIELMTNVVYRMFYVDRSMDAIEKYIYNLKK